MIWNVHIIVLDGLCITLLLGKLIEKTFLNIYYHRHPTIVHFLDQRFPNL